MPLMPVRPGKLLKLPDKPPGAPSIRTAQKLIAPPTTPDTPAGWPGKILLGKSSQVFAAHSPLSPQFYYAHDHPLRFPRQPPPDRPNRQRMKARISLSKRAKWRGDCAAGTSGDLVVSKPSPFEGKNKCRFANHTFLLGADNKVCSKCGHCEPIMPQPNLSICPNPPGKWQRKKTSPSAPASPPCSSSGPAAPCW